MKIKRNFLEKKIQKYSDSMAIIPIKSLQEEDNLTACFNVGVFLKNLKGKNVQLGKYYFFEDGTYYDSEKLLMFKTADLFVMIDTYMKNPVGRNIAPPNEISEYLGRIQDSFVDLLYIDLIFKETDDLVADLVDSNNNVIYLRGMNFWSEMKHIDGRFLISDIPLDKFKLIFNYDIETYRFPKGEKKRTVFIMTTEIDLVKVTKDNVDEILFDYYKDKATGLIPDNLKDFYENAYDDIYNKEKTGFLVDYNYSVPANYIQEGRNHYSNFLIFDEEINKDIKDRDSGHFLFPFFERIRFLCNYFKNLEDYSEINLQIFEKKIPGKKSWKVETRKSTIVKSHIRRYKSGVTTIVKTHTRGGTNYNKGICITFQGEKI
ncbi:hypothetical protein [Cetobacterium sp.]|uniref:hypothetical protein n=1 Tax=Cetobacterium sp. TaxID=2071632 RepID=UPI003F30E42F